MAKPQVKPTKMKLKVGDKIVVIAGSYKGKTGSIESVLPKTNQVIVKGVNVVKRHRKPSQFEPGGIDQITKPIFAAKVAILEPESKKPSRIGYQIKDNGEKVRIYKKTNKPITTRKVTKSKQK